MRLTALSLFECLLDEANRKVLIQASSPNKRETINKQYIIKYVTTLTLHITFLLLIVPFWSNIS